MLVEYNERCVPPWSQNELLHKLREAGKVAHREPRGHLRGSERLLRNGRPEREGRRAVDEAPVVEDRRNWREFDRGRWRGSRRGAVWMRSGCGGGVRWTAGR